MLNVQLGFTQIWVKESLCMADAQKCSDLSVRLNALMLPCFRGLVSWLRNFAGTWRRDLLLHAGDALNQGSASSTWRTETMHQLGHELRTNNEKSNSIAMTKGGRNYLPPLAGNRYTLLKNTKLKKYILPTPPAGGKQVYGRQKSPPSFLALDIGFTEVRDQWRARRYHLFAGGKWKSPLTDAAGKRRTQRQNGVEFWMRGLSLICPLKIRKDKGQYKMIWKILHVKIKNIRRNEKILQQKEDIKRLDNDS